jgi:hypothetical protein
MANEAQAGERRPLPRGSLHEVIGKLLLDRGFQEQFKRDPRVAIENAGLALTDNEYRAVSQMVKQLTEYANSPAVQQLQGFMESYIDRIKLA